MLPESQAVRVNFSKSFPVFPLEGVVLLPHAMLRLFIFEPRYRQMVEEALDGRGQIAMAIFQGDRWKQEYHGTPPIRKCVCVGQIDQHEKLPDGNYRILLHGICRAQILEEDQPSDERLYRQALLKPLEPEPPNEEELRPAVDLLLEMLDDDPMPELAGCRAVLHQIRENDLPPSVSLELLGLSLLNEKEIQYRLLCEGDSSSRVSLIELELKRIRSVLLAARAQFADVSGDGFVWN